MVKPVFSIEIVKGAQFVTVDLPGPTTPMEFIEAFENIKKKLNGLEPIIFRLAEKKVPDILKEFKMKIPLWIFPLLLQMAPSVPWVGIYDPYLDGEVGKAVVLASDISDLKVGDTLSAPELRQRVKKTYSSSHPRNKIQHLKRA